MYIALDLSGCSIEAWEANPALASDLENISLGLARSGLDIL